MKGGTALMNALLADHADVADLLLSNGADIDINARLKDGRTALMNAALFGNDDVVSWLLAKGADVNAKANDGSTALMDAALIGHEEVVERMLAKGADARARRNDGRTALSIARMTNHRGVATLLLENLEQTQPEAPPLVRPRHNPLRIAALRAPKAPTLIRSRFTPLRMAVPRMPQAPPSRWSATLPFRIGEPISEVIAQMARMGLPSITQTARQTHVSSMGVWLLFGRNRCVREIRLDAPFAGSVDGIRIGDVTVFGIGKGIP